VPALRSIHDLAAPWLLAELLQMLGDRKVAEAALTDCLHQIWQEAGNFNPQRSQPRTWLLSIARHHAIGILRGAGSGTVEEVDSALGFQHFALHYEGVPPEQHLLQLAWRTARSPAEIARALQLPLRRVQQEIRNGLAAMNENAVNLQGRALEYVAAAYALGTLNPRARRGFEKRLAHDIAARRAWQQWEERLSMLTPDIPPVRPPDNAWATLEKRLEQKMAPHVRRPRGRWLLVAAVIVAIAAAALLKWATP
jgi:RNA polymerase sigma-70 factor (ECF subfamily)